MNMTVIEKLKTTHLSSNINEVLDNLYDLRPDNLSLEQLIKLVNYLEKNCGTNRYPFKHYGIIGTGGDSIKTINISSIAAMVASQFVQIVKVGARGVTSMWGSKDFNQTFESSGVKSKINLNNFHFVSFTELGIDYGDTLVEARKKINAEGVLDIYKVIFPFADVTGLSGQVNGVSNSKYQEIFIQLAITYNRNTLIVRSEHGVDELLCGKNWYVRVKKGVIQERLVEIPQVTPNYLLAIGESEDIDNHVKQLQDVLTLNINEDILNTILYNSASILMLSEDIDIEFQVERIRNVLESSII